MLPAGQAAIAFGLVVLLPALLLILGFLKNRQGHEERLRMIEKGMLTSNSPIDLVRSAERIRLWGIVLVALGVGWFFALESFGAVTSDKDMMGLAASGVIPLLIGLGMLLDYWLRCRAIREDKARQGTQA